MPPQERKRRWRRIVLVLGIASVLLVSAAAAFVVTRQQGDVSNPDVEFRAEPSQTPEPDVEPDAPGKKKTDPVDRFIWGHYGYTRDRRRYLPLKDPPRRSEEHTSELQSHSDLVCRLLLEKKKKTYIPIHNIKQKKKHKNIKTE